jgi:single-strand DNA-binding protein
VFDLLTNPKFWCIFAVTLPEQVAKLGATYERRRGMYQKITIVGNLGRDPEMRYTPQGTPVTNFSVATTYKWTSADGTPIEETTWFRVSAWGRMAEVCNEYLSKGRQVLVEGRLRPDPQTGGPRVWTRQDGTAGASFEVHANTVKFLGGRGEVVGAEPGVTLEEPPPGVEEGEEELPF